MNIEQPYIYKIKSEKDPRSFYFMRLNKDQFDEFRAKGFPAKQGTLEHSKDYYIRVYPFGERLRAYDELFLTRDDIDIDFELRESPHGIRSIGFHEGSIHKRK